jgi:cytochrome P450
MASLLNASNGFGLDSGNNRTYFIAAVGVAGVVGWRLLSNTQKKLDENLPPVSSMGTLKYLTNLLGSQGPMFCLKMAREIGYVHRPPVGMKIAKCWCIIGDPKLARQILENPKNTKPKIAYEVFGLAASGDTFFSTDDARGMHVRKSTMPAFSPKNVENMEPIVSEAVERWIEQCVEPCLKAGTPIDISESVGLLTMDVIGRAAFEIVLDVEERRRLAEAVRTCMKTFFLQGINPLKRLFGFMFEDIRHARKLALEMKDFGLKIIRKCRENPNPNKQSVVYLMIHDDAYANDDERARDITLYFFGGYETTSHSIAWTVLELARNPEEQQKLRKALAEFLVKEPGTNPQYCPQLRNVSKEILRLHTPAALGSVREVSKDATVPGTNQIIPKGSFCSMVYYVILRNHNVFERADDFYPSRWENPTPEMQSAYMPFAAGKRNCQGQALARLELNSVVVSLCQRYSFDVVAEGEPYCMIALRPEGAKILLKKLEQ